MKISRLETHDRLQHLQQNQGTNLAQGAEECLKYNRLSLGLQQYSPYVYIYAHPRTLQLDERWKLWQTGLYSSWEQVPTHKMLWQPRLTKGACETNSYLFRAISNTDQMEICWMIPSKETWAQYKKGNVTEHAIVVWSIDQYRHNKPELEKPYPDDLPEHRIKEIYTRVAIEIDEEIRMDKLYSIKETNLNA